MSQLGKLWETLKITISISNQRGMKVVDSEIGPNTHLLLNIGMSREHSVFTLIIHVHIQCKAMHKIKMSSHNKIFTV